MKKMLAAITLRELRAPRTQQWFVVIGAGLVSLGISLWQLSVPEQLSFYNSGVYFAASYKLVTGIMPYRDFVFVQPPGILLALSPATLLSRVVGTHDGFVVARVMGAVVTGANASLLAQLLKRHGRVAMIVAGFGLALLPVAFWVSSAVMLEPYCIFCVLLGALILLGDGVAPASRRRVIVAGLLLGLGASVKLWALFPFLALLLCLVPRQRRNIRVVVASAISAFVAVSLPFFVVAPHNFISQVLVDQLGRSSNTTNDVTLLNRLVNLSGFSTSQLAPTAREALIAFGALTVFVLVAFRRKPLEDDRDVFFFAAALCTVAALLIAPEFYSYYAYFAAPFLVGVTATALARVTVDLRPYVRNIRVHVRVRVRQFVAWSVIASAVLAMFGAVLWNTSQYSAYAFGYGIYTPWLDAIDHHVPVDSCVLYSDVSFGVVTNRLRSKDSRCPNVVDPDGMLLNEHQGSMEVASLVSQWRTDFARSSYVVLLYPRVPRIPWNTPLEDYFTSHFREVYAQHYVFIFANLTADSAK